MGESREVAPRILTEETLHRTARVGVCPVMRVQVNYPSVSTRGDDPGARRFNETYRRAAVAFADWAVETIAPSVSEAFEAAGAGAAYRFARREAFCFITAHETEEGSVEVATTVTWGIKGEQPTRKIFVCEEIWRISEGRVERKDERTVGQFAKIKKSVRKLLKKRRKCGTIVQSVPE